MATRDHQTTAKAILITAAEQLCESLRTANLAVSSVEICAELLHDKDTASLSEQIRVALLSAHEANSDLDQHLADYRAKEIGSHALGNSLRERPKNRDGATITEIASLRNCEPD